MSPDQIDVKAEYLAALQKGREKIEQGREKIGDVLGADSPKGRVTVTAANWLTLIRLAIVPVFWFTFLSGRWGVEVAATLLFAFGAITDLWDGKLARKRGEVTAFGDFTDPLADKLLVLSGYWAILIREDFGSLFTTALVLVVLITLREVGLTLMRIWAIGGGSSVVTSIWGKIKTGVQLTTLLTAFTALNLRDYLLGVGHPWAVLDGIIFYWALTALFFLCTLTALVSGALYLKGTSYRPDRAS